MIRTLFLGVLCLLLTSSLMAQTNYYWADGNRLDLTASNTHFIITADDASTLTNINPVNLKTYQSWAHKTFAVLESANSTSPQDLVAELGFNNNEVQISPGYALSDGFIIYPTRTIVAQLVDKNDLGAMVSLTEKFGVRTITKKYGTYRIELEDVNQALIAANTMKESGLFLFAQPDFYAPIERFQINDPLFDEQFQMNNTGQTIDGVTGAVDADCNALEAWDISLGSSATTVAVIDDGMEDHEDFNNSSGQSRYTNGYTPATNGNGDAVTGSNHGVSCAGSISASHNNLGVRGVAPLADMISVNIFAGGETTQDIADGITWAKDAGADVMSNSWGYTSCTVSFPNINAAISDANSNGRGGLGCVIVFASGNGYKACVDYPANNANVIAVGAFANTGIRSAYSNYGPTLDIMAPSNNVGGPGAGVRTTDRMGGPGYNSTNYTSTFGGTSSACPVVAGVATLVLGYNSSLTAAEVKDILYSTAIDMGPPGDDNEYANGRVNALGALQAAGGSTPTCDDGIQNGDEEGVDCGGSSCPACPDPCDSSPNTITVSITLDNYPEETSWDIRDASNNVIASGGTYGSQPDGSTVTIDVCAADGCYDFTIYDSYGDGICCAYGNGSYTVTDQNGTVLASGGEFGSSETTNFCLGGPPPPTCDDGVQNGDEEGVDCGGSSCPPCSTGGEILGSYFETGWDGWQDGGSDCYRYSGTRSWEGSYSIRIRDNSGTASAMTSPVLDLTGYSSIDIQFYFYPNSMETGEDFWLRYYNGSSWSTVATWASGTSFNNNSFYTATVTLDASNVNFASNSQIRFQCDASGNADRIYIDAVTVNASVGQNNTGSSPDGPIVTIEEVYQDRDFELVSNSIIDQPNLSVYPNPARDLLNINTEMPIESVQIVSVSGQLMRTIQGNSNYEEINISDLQAGMYYILIRSKGDLITEKFIKL